MLDIVDAFNEILSPEFFEEFYQLQPYHFKSVGDRHSVNELFDLTKVDRLLGLHGVLENHVAVIRDGSWSENTIPRTQTGSLSLQGFRQAVKDGGSILFMYLEKYDENIRELSKILERRLGNMVKVNAYVTPPHCTGYRPHYDPHDIFVLQCYGSKEWHLYENYEEKIECPDRFTPFERNKHVVDRKTYKSVVLEEGDFLYLPRGLMHAASCHGSPSCHVTFDVRPFSWADYINVACNILREEHSSFRYACDVKPYSASQKYEGFGDQIRQRLDLVANLNPVIVERKLYELYSDLKGAPEAASISSILSPANLKTISDGNYIAKISSNSLCRCFQNSHGEYYLWTRDHECQLTEKEYITLSRFLEGQTMDRQEVEHIMGPELEGQFVQNLLALGVVELSKAHEHVRD